MPLSFNFVLASEQILGISNVFRKDERRLSEVVKQPCEAGTIFAINRKIENMVERWIEIPGYERYLISDHGNIFSKWSNKNLKPTLCKNTGYLMVDLKILGKKRRVETVHRLVAESFCQRPIASKLVNHINCIKTDNHYKNLEWTTRKDNFNHSQEFHGKIGNSKLDKNKVIEIIRMHESKQFQIKHIAKVYCVSSDTISRIVNKKSWDIPNLEK